MHHCCFYVVVVVLLASLVLSAQAVEASYSASAIALPHLVVRTSNVYLSKRGGNILHCAIESSPSIPPSRRQLSANRKGVLVDTVKTNADTAARLTDVRWLRNGVLIRAGRRDPRFSVDGPMLSITSGRRTEGKYQCMANITNLRVTTSNGGRRRLSLEPFRLLSAAVSLRKAFLRKFVGARKDKKPILVEAVQGQVAYIPCPGVPRSMPEPPELSFRWESWQNISGVIRLVNQTIEQEKYQESDRYLITDHGMQIAVVQPEDAGQYWCIGSNRWSEQVRESYRYVELKIVETVASIVGAEAMLTTVGLPKPRLVHPTPAGKELVLEMREDDAALLDCVGDGGRVVWQRENKIIRSTDESHIKPLWGNLRISRAKISDSGFYKCIVVNYLISPMNTDAIITGDFPFVTYVVKVHPLPKAKLDISHDETGGWSMECHGEGSRPSLYLNGLPFMESNVKLDLIDVEMYSNPVRVEIGAGMALNATVQCLVGPEAFSRNSSRANYGHSDGVYLRMLEKDHPSTVHSPAAVGFEARPENVTRLEGESATMLCVAENAVSTHWEKDGSKLDIYDDSRFAIIGSSTLEIQHLMLSDAGWYRCIAVGADGTTKDSGAYLNIQPDPTLFIANELDPSSPIDTPLPIIDSPKVEIFGTVATITWRLPSTSHLTGEHVRGVTAESRQLRHHESSSSRPQRPKWQRSVEFPPAQTSFSFADLTPGARYQFRVTYRTETRRGESRASVAYDIPVTNGAENNLSAPAIVEVKPLDNGTISVKWDYVGNTLPEGFIVKYWANKDDKEEIRVANGVSREEILRHLRPATVYKVQVQAYSMDGTTGATSSTEEVETLPPTVPLDGEAGSNDTSLAPFTPEELEETTISDSTPSTTTTRRPTTTKPKVVLTTASSKRNITTTTRLLTPTTTTVAPMTTTTTTAAVTKNITSGETTTAEAKFVPMLRDKVETFIRDMVCLPVLDERLLLAILGSVVGVLILLLVCCLVCCLCTQRKKGKVTEAAKGKYVDASQRIFNEQKTTLQREKLDLYVTTLDRNYNTAGDENLPLNPSGSAVGTYQRSMAKPNLYSQPAEDDDDMPSIGRYSSTNMHDGDLNATHGLLTRPHGFEDSAHIFQPHGGDMSGQPVLLSKERSTPECDLMMSHGHGIRYSPSDTSLTDTGDRALFLPPPPPNATSSPAGGYLLPVVGFASPYEEARAPSWSPELSPHRQHSLPPAVTMRPAPLAVPDSGTASSSGGSPSRQLLLSHHSQPATSSSGHYYQGPPYAPQQQQISPTGTPTLSGGTRGSGTTTTGGKSPSPLPITQADYDMMWSRGGSRLSGAASSVSDPSSSDHHAGGMKFHTFGKPERNSQRSGEPAGSLSTSATGAAQTMGTFDKNYARSSPRQQQRHS